MKKQTKVNQGELLYQSIMICLGLSAAVLTLTLLKSEAESQDQIESLKRIYMRHN